MARASIQPSQKKLIANELCVLFQEALKNSVPRRRVASKPPKKIECKQCGCWFFANSPQLCEKCRKPSAIAAHTIDEIDQAARRAFLSAAAICIELEADARDYVIAQFAAWRDASTYHKKLLLPQPHHLGTLAARVRYLQFKAREEVRLSLKDVYEDEPDDKRWFVEERKLNAIARSQRRDPIDVITEQPEQFSREFLMHKGVWGVVDELWEERNQ